MNIKQKILLQISAGFFHGIGFMLATTIVGFFAFSFMKSNVEGEKQNLVEKSKKIEKDLSLILRQYDESAKLTISVTKEKIDQNEFTLLGTISNKGDGKWSAITVKAELFNETGQFINECSQFINQNSIPGSTINFKLSCSNTYYSKFELHGYSSYKIGIVSALPGR